MTSRCESRGGGPRAARSRLGVLLAAGLAVGLSGCGEGTMSDLESYRDEVLARKGKRPDPLPPPALPVTYAYVGGEDPFAPFYVEPPSPPDDGGGGASDNGITPDLDRNREELESHPLDALRMMGTLELEDQVWGIIRSPDAVIHRVQAGNYMGRNHGKILSVNEDSIEIVEIIPDGQGGWQERDVSIALAQ